MAKKLYRIPLNAQSIEVLHWKADTKKQKDTTELLKGFDVTFAHNDLVFNCFLTEAPTKKGIVTADLEVAVNFDKLLEMRIISIKK